MIRLMIVDDEKIVREGIQFIVDHTFKDQIIIVASAKTGREAIEKYEETTPHIVLMDIQMPGINGIEAIRSIREHNDKVKCIVISAYEQFEYAQQAVELGVKEYILKPINRKKLIEVIQKVIDEIEQEKKLKQKEIENQEKIDQILPVLEHGFIYSILMNNDFKKEIKKYQDLFMIKKNKGYMMVIEIGEGFKPAKLRNKIGTGFKSQIQYENIRNAIKYKCKCIVGPIIVNRIAVLVYESHCDDEYDQRVQAIELAECIKNNFEKFIQSQVYIGIGTNYLIDEINISYEEAVKALSKINGEGVLHIKDAVEILGEKRRTKILAIKRDEENIIQKIEDGNTKEVKRLLGLFFSKIDKELNLKEVEIRNLLIELSVLIHMTAYRNDVLSDDMDFTSYLDEIQTITLYYELQLWCLNKALSIAEKIKGEKATKVSNVIFEAKQFIDKNYNKEIGLKETSEAVCISPQYFSKIFKEEIGVTFIEYLTKVRIDHAKKMLKEKNMSIKEICYEIGYNDPNYFSRLFKKIEGVSPTEYC